MNTKSILWIAATVALLASEVTGRAEQGIVTITHEAANPAIKTTYSKTIEFCCGKCKAQFDASPKAYMPAIQKARKGQCPLSNKSSVAGKSSVYSREVAFKDAAAKAKFEGSPDIYISQVKQ